MTSPPGLSEADLQRRIIDTATVLGWMVSHTRPARTSHGWRTPVTGHRGAPDLLLARGGRCLLVELKSHRGRLGPGQRDWLDALGDHGRLWTPAGWARDIARKGELAARQGGGPLSARRVVVVAGRPGKPPAGVLERAPGLAHQRAEPDLACDEDRNRILSGFVIGGCGGGGVRW